MDHVLGDGGMKWTRMQKNCCKQVFAYSLNTHLTYAVKASIDTNWIHSPAQIKTILQMSLHQALLIRSLILSLYFTLSFLYLSMTLLSPSFAYLQATYQSQDGVGTAALLWQDQSFEELLNNSNYRGNLRMFFLGRGVKPCDRWRMIQSVAVHSPSKTLLGSNPAWSIVLCVCVVIHWSPSVSYPPQVNNPGFIVQAALVRCLKRSMLEATSSQMITGCLNITAMSNECPLPLLCLEGFKCSDTYNQPSSDLTFFCDYNVS